jgi:hypothetical protein
MAKLELRREVLSYLRQAKPLRQFWQAVWEAAVCSSKRKVGQHRLHNSEASSPASSPAYSNTLGRTTRAQLTFGSDLSAKTST